MLRKRDPYDAYQRVEFDARVRGANAAELVHVCYDQFVNALGAALVADQRRDALLRSRSLTRALTAVMALQLGVDHEHDMAGALGEFYGAARKSVLASSLSFDRARLEEIRKDFTEVRDGFALARD